MRIELTQAQAQAQLAFQEFAEQQIKPLAQKMDEEEQFSPELIKQMAQEGYLGVVIPEAYGGTEMDMLTIGILNEEIGRVCSATRSLLTVHGMAALAIARWGSDEQKSKWLGKLASGEALGAFGLTEPNVGSDAKSVETTALETPEGFILNGKKKWITFGQVADLFIIFAQCEGKPTAFIVEKGTPGFSAKPLRGLLGTRASMLAELTFTECKIPLENIVGRIGTGLSHIALTALDYGRYTIAFGCVGLSQACLDECLRYSRKRKQFGKPLRESQLIKKMITEMVVNVEAARLLCYQAGYLKDTKDPDSIMKTWFAKYFASKIVNTIASDAVQIHGANGCASEYPIARFFRDARINEIIEGTSQMHEILIATNAFRGVVL